jgi:diadenosine tetraphosphate (Ap4A) HIT family hydrolase
MSDDDRLAKQNTSIAERSKEPFALDARLAADSCSLGELYGNEVLLFNEQRYDWLVLVPRVAGAVELFDLSAAQQQQLAVAVEQVALTLKRHGRGYKLNIGALGNVVRQLHIHVVLRAETDAAWPGPVWGHSPRQPLSTEQLTQAALRWRELLQLG